MECEFVKLLFNQAGTVAEQLPRPLVDRPAMPATRAVASGKNRNPRENEPGVLAKSRNAGQAKSLDRFHAAVVPISALTAWQGLFEKAQLEPGQRVLIHGAAGGVGTFAVQLARWRGAYVIATASTANLDFVRSLGANEVLDYRNTRFEDAVKDVDVVWSLSLKPKARRLPH